MITFREKLFNASKINSKKDVMDNLNNITRCPFELLKSIEMFGVDNGKHIKHWIKDKIIGSNIYDYCFKLNFSPQIFFAGIDDNDKTLNREFGINVVNNFRDKYKTSLDFTNSLKNNLLKERKDDEFKYREVLGGVVKIDTTEL